MTNRVRRTMPILPISIVMQLTDLTARQIRYYEEQKLIDPARTEGNKRMFSLNDVDTLMEIKEYLEQGLNVAGIRKLHESKNMPVNENTEPHTLSDEELRRLLREEMKHQARPFNAASQRQGDLSRFFK